MKRLLLGLMLLMIATAASAEWTIAGDNENFNQYVDKATIRRDGNFVKMWDLLDYKRVKVIGGKSDLSQRTQKEYDCKEEKVRILVLTSFSGQMGNGTINYDDSNTEKWRPVAPGTVNETLWKIACGKQ